MAEPKPPAYDGYLSTGGIARPAKDKAQALAFARGIVESCLRGTAADLTEINWDGAVLQGEPASPTKRVLVPAAGAVQKAWRSREGKTFRADKLKG